MRILLMVMGFLLAIMPTASAAVYQQGVVCVLYDETGDAAVKDKTDINSNGVPDVVEDIAAQVNAAREVFNGVFEFTDPLDCERFKNVTSIEIEIEARDVLKFNGTAYIVQRGAEAIYSDEGQAQIKVLVNYYLENARIIRESLSAAGLKTFGGVNAPYIWLKTPDDIPSSWDFFDKLLHTKYIIGTPGAGFGPCGEGYLRLTSFNSRENTIEACERLKTFS